MTYSTDIKTSGSVFGNLAARFALTFSDLRDAVTRRTLYRATLRELQALSPRELDDLGLSRDMIRSVAYEAAYGK